MNVIFKFLIAIFSIISFTCCNSQSLEGKWKVVSKLKNGYSDTSGIFNATHIEFTNKKMRLVMEEMEIGFAYKVVENMIHINGEIAGITFKFEGEKLILTERNSVNTWVTELIKDKNNSVSSVETNTSVLYRDRTLLRGIRDPDGAEPSPPLAASLLRGVRDPDAIHVKIDLPKDKRKEEEEEQAKLSRKYSARMAVANLRTLHWALRQCSEIVGRACTIGELKGDRPINGSKTSLLPRDFKSLSEHDESTVSYGQRGQYLVLLSTLSTDKSEWIAYAWPAADRTLQTFCINHHEEILELPTLNGSTPYLGMEARPQARACLGSLHENPNPPLTEEQKKAIAEGKKPPPATHQGEDLHTWQRWRGKRPRKGK